MNKFFSFFLNLFKSPPPMETVKIIGIYEPGKISFAQKVISQLTATTEEFVCVYYLHDKNLKTIIRKKDEDKYVPIHVPKDAIIGTPQAISDPIISVEDVSGAFINNTKYEIILNTLANCFVFQHPKANVAGSAQHELSVLVTASGLVGSLIDKANGKIDKNKIKVSNTNKFDLNGTDTKPPCNVSSVLVQ